MHLLIVHINIVIVDTVKALNSIFQQWGTKAPKLWNISGEPCSGSAIDETYIWDQTINPAIKCNCTYNTHTTCHITELYVFSFSHLFSYKCLLHKN